jgi:hypothetical protein
MTLCIYRKGPRIFCGKEECTFHFDKSFASFKGMCCGSSDSKKCEENGCNCGKKKVDCWDKEKNGDITPYDLAIGAGKRYKPHFICPYGHSFQKILDAVTTKKD